MAYTITIDSDGGVAQNGYGDAGVGAIANYAIPFTTSAAGTISSVAYSSRKVGTPVDMSKVGLMADVAGAPSGTFLDSGSNTITTTGCLDYTATFGGPVSVTATTQYWVVFSRTGATNTSNRYIACGSASPPSSGGAYALDTAPTTYLVNGPVCGASCSQNYAQMTVTTSATAALPFRSLMGVGI